MHKLCKVCKKKLPLENFSKIKNSYKRIYFRNTCKKCYRCTIQKKYIKNNLEKHREMMARAMRNIPMWKKVAYREKWREKNRQRFNEMHRCHVRIMRALKAGKLKKKSCEVCGVKNVHAHHEDYSKPLEVRWLCPLHHKNI